MFKFSRKPAWDEMLGKYALELAMFMRWCETCGPGQLSPARCQEIAERIMARERFQAAAVDPFHIATLATMSSFVQIDELRARTGFDSKVKGFCDSIGIAPPAPRARADLPDKLKLFGQDTQAALSRLVSDTGFRAELGCQIMAIQSSLSLEDAMKVGYACAAKLIAAEASGYRRPVWEANVCQMLMDTRSPPVSIRAARRERAGSSRRRWASGVNAKPKHRVIPFI